MAGEAEQRERFARALQEAMTARKVSARQLAMKIEVDPRRIAAWIKAKGLPNLYEAARLTEALRVREDLFKNPPEVPPPPPYPIGEYLLGAVASGVEEGLRRDRSRAPSSDEPPARSRRPRPLADGAGHG